MRGDGPYAVDEESTGASGTASTSGTESQSETPLPGEEELEALVAEPTACGSAGDQLVCEILWVNPLGPGNETVPELHVLGAFKSTRDNVNRVKLARGSL